MKLVCISDTHNRHNDITLPEGDILIHAGDLTGRGSTRELTEVFNWLRSISKNYKHIIFIAGNHDFGLQDNPFDNTLPMNVHYLQDTYIVIEDLKIYGSPWTPTFYNWAFMKDEEDLEAVFKKIPKDTDVLVTHGPPRSILDSVRRTGESVGSTALFGQLERMTDLKVHIFGHIHEGYGHTKINDTDFYNVALLNERYEIANNPILINL